jgi:hypothetical protein
MTHPIKITDHKQRGLGLILSQFSEEKAPRLRALISILMDRVQEFEDLAYDVLLEQLIENAQGVHLERLGRRIGEKRGSFTDDDEYRRVIKARALANASECAIQTIIDITETVMEPHLSVPEPNIRLYQHGRKHIRVEYDVDTDPGDALRLALVRLVGIAKCGGTSYRVIEVDNSDSFRYDLGPGYDVGTYARIIGYG